MNSFVKKITNAYQDQPVLWKPLTQQKKSKTKHLSPSYQEEINKFIGQKQHILILGTRKTREEFPYMLPILEVFKTKPRMCVLLVFSTNTALRKRLENFQSQFPSLAHLADAYDSTTPAKQRTDIRNECRFIFTNPDMVHCSTLANHRYWRYFLSHLDFIVFEDVHNYSGIFGGHVANVIRRLLRLSELYGSSSTVIGTSNVFKNPVEFFKSLTGSVPNIVEEETVTPYSDANIMLATFDLDTSTSTTYLTTSLLITLLLMEKTCVILVPSQAIAEQIINPAKNLLTFNSLNPQTIDTYFSNDTIERKKNIKQLFDKKKIKALITHTLTKIEIDLLKADILIIHGYPGQNNKLWQEIETFSQNKKEPYIFLILRKDPLQQHIFKYPDILSHLNPIYCPQQNYNILQDHLLLAASETPLQYQEVERFGNHALNAIEDLESQGRIVRQHFHFKPKTPLKAIHINLRLNSKQNISLIQNNQFIKKVDLPYVLKELFPGAIYFADQKAFQVDSLDLENKEIYTTEILPTYLTQPIRKYQLIIKKTLESKKKCYYCSIQLNIQTVAYQKIYTENYSPLDLVPLDIPPYIMSTESVHLRCNDATRIALHGLEHILWIVSPLITGTNRQEIGFYHTLTPYSEVIFFDLQPGGTEISKLLYDNMSLALHQAKEFLENCTCENGCSQCLWHNSCPTENQDLSRPLTLQLINNILKDF